jgi:hydrogenase-1 operon protein HyaF
VSKLEDIPVRVEYQQPKTVKPDTVGLVLGEILAALKSLHDADTTHAIDLRQLPRMSAETYQRLRDALMHGEVTAVVQTQVKVEVAETRYPGVWWLRYFNEHEEITTEIIEVSKIPVILVPHRVDILGGLKRLEEYLHIGNPLIQPMAKAV